MNGADLLTLQFLLACASCMAVGSLVWLLTSLVKKELGASRSVWMLGQLTIVAAFFLMMLPQSERLRIVPAIELEESLGAPKATSPASAAAVMPGVAGQGSEARPVHALGYAAQGWLIMYLLGLGYSVRHVCLGRRALQGLAATGSELAIGASQAASTAAGRLRILEVNAPISPMLFGVLRPKLLVPEHMRSFEPMQRQLIVEHELTHLRRKDLLWMSAAIALQAIFWFNPFMRLLGKQLLWAQELGCDREVLQGRPDEERRAYAAALVTQLRYQRQASHAALAFGCFSAQTVAARIARIRTPSNDQRSGWVRHAVWTGLALILAGSAAFQPALAWKDRTLSCTIMADAATGELLLSEGQCDARVTPASTFNIVVSLMGYDSGILQDEHAPRLPFKPGYPDYVESWRADTDPAGWLRDSVLWYAQQVTARLGRQQFVDYIARLGYGNGDVTGDPGQNNGLSMSWLSSSLTISPAEQVSFLRKVVNRQLPLSAKAYEMTARIMPANTTANGWEIRGKTGTATPVLASGADDERLQYGWYVGWARKGTRTVVFARLIMDERKQGSYGGMRAKRDFIASFPQRTERFQQQAGI